MKFSILIPAYKAKFLKESIESVLTQTCDDFETIIVNDASPEDLDSVVKSYNDPRIKYYVNERNCGAINVVDNWNKCLSYAKGDYVICMGDDDKLKPNCLEEYNKLMERYPGLGVYHAWTELIDVNSKVIAMQETRPEYESVYSMMWGRWYGRRLQYIGDFLFDRNLLVNNGGFYKLPLAWGADDISAYIAASEKGIANMQVPGFQYRINSQTISSKGDASIKLNAINIAESWYQDFLAMKPKGNNVTEEIFWKMLRNYLNRAMAKQRVFTISTDLVSHGIFGVFKFFIHRKNTHTNIKIIAYSLLDSMKQKQVSK